MTLPQVHANSLTASHLAIGGNSFSGISHQEIKAHLEMGRYHTLERIRAALREAESLGISTVEAICALP